MDTNQSSEVTYWQKHLKACVSEEIDLKKLVKINFPQTTQLYFEKNALTLTLQFKTHTGCHGNKSF